MKPSSKRAGTATTSSPLRRSIRAAGAGGRTKWTRPASGTASMIAGIVKQPRLQIPRRLAGRRFDLEAVPLGDCGYVFRPPARQQLALTQHKNPVATLGFVEIGRAHQHGEALLAHQPYDDVPQFAARQRIDADRRLVEQEHVRRPDQRAGKPKLLLHAARQIAGEPLRERGRDRSSASARGSAGCALPG